jgi:hypothetical protein
MKTSLACLRSESCRASSTQLEALPTQPNLVLPHSSFLAAMRRRLGETCLHQHAHAYAVMFLQAIHQNQHPGAPIHLPQPPVHCLCCVMILPWKLFAAHCRTGTGPSPILRCPSWLPSNEQPGQRGTIHVPCSHAPAPVSNPVEPDLTLLQLPLQARTLPQPPPPLQTRPLPRPLTALQTRPLSQSPPQPAPFPSHWLPPGKPLWRSPWPLLLP